MQVKLEKIYYCCILQVMLSKDKRPIPPNLVMPKMYIRVTTVRFGVPIGTLDVGVTNVAIPLSNNLIALVSYKPQTLFGFVG